MDLPSTSSAQARVNPHRFRPILFRRATSVTYSAGADCDSSQDEDGSCQTIDSVAGQEARHFYENLIAEGSQVLHHEEDNQKRAGTNTKQRTKHKKRSLIAEGSHVLHHEQDNQKLAHTHPTQRTKRKIRSCSRTKHSNDEMTLSDKEKKKLGNNLLQGAQDGDMKKVQDALKHGCNINWKDDFHWTALMCACHSGQVHVVRYLLQNGALWEDLHDKKGRTALGLAKAANHMNIHDLLLTHSCGRLESGRRSRRHKQELYGYSCQICKMDVKETSKAEHESSTVHLFNCQHKPQSTFYHIPEGNIGFQLLLKDGWDKEQGLGPDGQGSKFPVKTVLKRDRQGLGANPDDPQSKPRVTHFQPHDIAAVKKPKTKRDGEEKKMRANTVSKKNKVKQERRERAWEIDFRQSFNTLE